VRIISIARPRPTSRAGVGCRVARNEPQRDLRLAQLRGVGGNPERARHGELAATAERVAVDRGDHRLAHVLDQIEDLLAVQRVSAPRGRRLDSQLVDVRARDEGLVAGPGEDHDPDGVVLPKVEHHAAQFLERS
jgi:hypothetical protein